MLICMSWYFSTSILLVTWDSRIQPYVLITWIKHWLVGSVSFNRVRERIGVRILSCALPVNDYAWSMLLKSSRAITFIHYSRIYLAVREFHATLVAAESWSLTWLPTLLHVIRMLPIAISLLLCELMHCVRCLESSITVGLPHRLQWDLVSYQQTIA